MGNCWLEGMVQSAEPVAEKEDVSVIRIAQHRDPKEGRKEDEEELACHVRILYRFTVFRVLFAL